MKKRLNASISLTTVILVMAILITGGATIVISTIDLADYSKSFQNHVLARGRTITCFEESLYKLKNDSTYTGTVTYSYSDGSCEATTNDDVSPGVKNILLTGVIGEFSFTETRKLDISTYPYLILD